MSTVKCFLFLDIACGVIVLAFLQIACWLMAAYRQAQKIRVTLFRAIMRQEIGWFDTHDAGELNTRLNEYDIVLMPVLAYYLSTRKKRINFVPVTSTR